MNWKKLTQIIVVAAVLILVGYDIVAVFQGGDGATVSAFISHAAHSYPVLPFAFGVLCGHWFWTV